MQGFQDFVEDFLLKFEYEDNHPKIKYFKAHLTDLALDAFLGRPEDARRGNDFSDVVGRL